MHQPPGYYARYWWMSAHAIALEKTRLFLLIQLGYFYLVLHIPIAILRQRNARCASRGGDHERATAPTPPCGHKKPQHREEIGGYKKQQQGLNKKEYIMVYVIKFFHVRVSQSQ